jgi:hypothetical protein
MARHTGSALVAALAFGCGRETPNDVRIDVAHAQTEGAVEVAAVKREGETRLAAARDDHTRTDVEVANTRARSVENDADAQAQARYRVAIARCEGSAGATRDSCKSDAAAELAVARARAADERAANKVPP